MRRVVVTGLGAVTPLGVGIQHAWPRLLASESGIVSLSDQSFSYLPCRVAGRVPRADTSTSSSSSQLSSSTSSKSNGTWNPTEWLLPGDERRMALFSQYAIAASEMALRDSLLLEEGSKELNLSKASRLTMGVCIGSGIGSIQDTADTTVVFQNRGYKKVSAMFVPRLLVNLAAGHVSMRYGLHGPNHCVSTACAAGTHAIGDAYRFIKFGDSNIMLAGASESCIHPVSISGFSQARALARDWNETPELASRPFDKDRAGFVMGEGSGIVVLEELSHALKRKAPIYAEILGYGLSSDAHHMTSPSEDGKGVYLSMLRALRHARVEPRMIDYINAHATSTQRGDAAENSAIKSLFLKQREQGKEEREGAMNNASLLNSKEQRGTEEIDQDDESFDPLLFEKHDDPKSVAVSSSKGAIGHLLGAAGAVEAIFTVLSVKHDVLPPTLNLNSLEDSGEFSLNYIPKVKQEKIVDYALTNSSGFGGTNATLVFKKFKG